MSHITELHGALLDRILRGAATASLDLRQAAFDNAVLDEPIRTLIDKVAHQSYRVSDEDIVAAKSAGLSEDQIFEIVVCAAVGQAGRQYDSALAALTAAADDRGRQ